MSRIYKILIRRAWDEALVAGVFLGAPIDIQDGYIHFSTAAQAQETASKHFVGQHDLILVGFEAEALGDGLKWEPSRGGQLFPHLYGPLPTSKAISLEELPLDAGHIPIVPELAP